MLRFLRHRIMYTSLTHSATRDVSSQSRSGSARRSASEERARYAPRQAAERLVQGGSATTSWWRFFGSAPAFVRASAAPPGASRPRRDVLQREHRVALDCERRATRRRGAVRLRGRRDPLAERRARVKRRRVRGRGARHRRRDLLERTFASFLICISSTCV